MLMKDLSNIHLCFCSGRDSFLWCGVSNVGCYCKFQVSFLLENKGQLWGCSRKGRERLLYVENLTRDPRRNLAVGAAMIRTK